MDDLLEHTVKGLLKGLYLLLRVLIWAMTELACERIAWPFGWCACRLLTLNRRPRVAIGDYDAASTLTACVVCTVGFVVLAGLAACLGLMFGVA